MIEKNIQISLNGSNAKEKAVQSKMDQDQQDKFLDQYFELIVKQQEAYLDKKSPYQQDIGQDENLACQICFQQFSSKSGDSKSPFMLVECGHTFCFSCTRNFSGFYQLGFCIRCPLDNTINPKATPNFLVINLIDQSKQQFDKIKKHSLEPKCEQHSGQSLIFYNPTDTKFCCQMCIQTGADHFTTLKEHVFISYEKIKPQLLQRLDARIKAIKPSTSDSSYEVCMDKIQEIQDNLIYELETKRDEIIYQITEETKKKIDHIQKQFKKEMLKQTTQIQMMRLMKEWADEWVKRQECYRFLREFGNLLNQNSESIGDEKINYKQFIDCITKENSKAIESNDAERQAANQIIQFQMNEEELAKFHENYFKLIAIQLEKYLDKKLSNPEQNDSLSCSICFNQFSSKKNDNNCPMMLKDCGHTFCQSCTYKFQVRHMQHSFKCPLDKVLSKQTIINYHLLGLIEHSKFPNQEFRPTCEYHQGKDIIFYNPSQQKFSCQECLNDRKANNAIPILDGLHFISYDNLKPQIFERINSRINAIIHRDLEIQDEINNSYIQDQKQVLIDKIEAQRQLAMDSAMNYIKDYERRLGSPISRPIL
ncbi:hypothetical protein FGO68_gene312 [Halteria grandinella]|uniref:RING-type domain-containing protein n=1 Tax=Halteria grandinella TaxID=5974 RepID=A0A8J8P3P4_HALGN|nr:hypothetical protein FGO68_gene312 [Halteria grandinella]